MHIYPSLVISGHDKNKQLTLLMQTCIYGKKYVNGIFYSEGYLKNK
jgi:hypothetical protein